MHMGVLTAAVIVGIIDEVIGGDGCSRGEGDLERFPESKIRGKGLTAVTTVVGIIDESDRRMVAPEGRMTWKDSQSERSGG